MSWKPNAIVTIDGVDYSDTTLIGATVNYGRQTIWEQPKPGYANIRIYNPSNVSQNFEIRHSVTISIRNSSGVDVTIFTGKIVAVQNVLDAVGSADKVTVTQITAISTIAELGRIIIGAYSFPKEYDDDRMTRILTATGLPLDTIDSPGVYEFTAKSGDATDALTLASTYANMAFGYIYETADGEIGYANESRRLLDAVANGYLNIPDEVILGESVQSERSLNNLLNDLTLFYKNNQSVTASNPTSIATYGAASAQITTELEDGTEAQFQADRYVTLRSIARTNVQELSVRLENPSMSNSLRNSLISIYLGMPVKVTNLPASIFSGIYEAFVENWTFVINRETAILAMTTTDNSYSIPPTRWQDVSATVQWEDVDPAVEWANYE